MTNLKLTLFTMLAFACVFKMKAQDQFKPIKNEKVNVIFDSDMGPDYDDVGAIAMLHAYADSGYVNILGTIASTSYKGVASVFDIFNTYYNKPEIPIGVSDKALNLRDWQFWSDTIRAKYPHTIKENNEVSDAVELYRKLLASQPDNSVTIITVGFLTNIANLLKSGPDRYSPLDGKKLIAQKVRLMVSMAGGFPTGHEFNVANDPKASCYVFNNWEKPLLLSGFEIGSKIKVGLKLIADKTIQNSPVKDVFSICIPKDKKDINGRSSWDETAVLAAVKGYEPYFTIKTGTIICYPDGRNAWNNQGENHAYLIEKIDHAEMEDIIEKTIMHQPMR